MGADELEKAEAAMFDDMAQCLRLCLHGMRWRGSVFAARHGKFRCRVDRAWGLGPFGLWRAVVTKDDCPGLPMACSGFTCFSALRNLDRCLRRGIRSIKERAEKDKAI